MGPDAGEPEFAWDLQNRVHRAIVAVGGYWPPEAGALRLFEEVGELFEAIARPETSQAASEEVADIAIICICIGNQFLCDLSPTHPDRDRFKLSAAIYRDLIVYGARVARLINHYSGPKKPKVDEVPPPLTNLLRDVIECCRALLLTDGLNLDEVVANKLAVSVQRDSQRFSVGFDPSTAYTLDQFNSVQEGSPCVFAKGARLWGAPRWHPARSTQHNADLVAPYLERFLKASISEHLDAFILLLEPEPKSLERLAAALRNLLTALQSSDPTGNRPMSSIGATQGWQFSFSGIRTFISVFAPIYPTTHPRHAPQTYIMFQPESSFGHCGIGSAFARSDQAKIRVRNSFIEHGFAYPTELIEKRVEAYLYLMGLDPAVAFEWWDEPDRPRLF